MDEVSRENRLAEVTAAILAGGLGTRLRTVVSDRPKVLAEIHGRPFILYLLDQLAEAGIRRIVLCTGYQGEQVEAALGGEYRGMALAYSQETTPLGTGGAVRFALPQLESPTVLVMNGDSYCAADLPRFWNSHCTAGFDASLLLTRVADTSRFGRVRTDETGRVLRFDEKGGEIGPGWINGGVYLLSKARLAEIPFGRTVSLERDCFPAWTDGGLGGCRSESRFLDIGTPESYAEAERFFVGQVSRHARSSPTCRAFVRAAPHKCGDYERQVGNPPHARPRCVLLDRDGTIIFERHYLSDPDQVELLPGTAEGLRRLRALGLRLVVVTNQSGLGRGYFDANAVERVHARLRQLLEAEGVHLDGIYVCPHHPDDACPCRKPRPELVHRAARDLSFRPEEAFVVGDKACDVELGRAAGSTTFLVRTGYGAQIERDRAARPDHVADDLCGVAALIEKALKARSGRSSALVAADSEVPEASEIGVDSDRAFT